MANTREIRRRIRSVKNIAQVTKAMEAVSAARMRKAQAQVLATRPYAQQAREVLSYVAKLAGTESNSLIKPRAVIKRIGILLVTADRGLAGGFNANVIRHAAALIREKRKTGVEVQVVTLGKKGRDWLLRYDPVIRAEFTKMPDSPTTADTSPVARILIDDYVQGQFDEVYAVYTDFVNTIKQVPVTHKLLPIEPTSNEPTTMAAEYIFEPSAEAVLNQVVLGLTEVQILQALYESLASEHSSRMVAMRNATDAAGELIGSLTLTYNKARQEGITTELMDIIGGSAGIKTN